jgi:hypothetical protein
MYEDMVMRSVYLRPSEDSQLRQLAHELNVTKSDLIRSAISVKLQEWLEASSDELVLHDLESGKRDSAAERAARAGKAKIAARAASPVVPWLESDSDELMVHDPESRNSDNTPQPAAASGKAKIANRAASPIDPVTGTNAPERKSSRRTAPGPAGGRNARAGSSR